MKNAAAEMNVATNDAYGGMISCLPASETKTFISACLCCPLSLYTAKMATDKDRSTFLTQG